MVTALTALEIHCDMYCIYTSFLSVLTMKISHVQFASFQVHFQLPRVKSDSQLAGKEVALNSCNLSGKLRVSAKVT